MDWAAQLKAAVRTLYPLSSWPNQTRPDQTRSRFKARCCPPVRGILRSGFCAVSRYLHHPQSTSSGTSSSRALPVPRRPSPGPVRCGFHLALESSLTHSLTLILTFASSLPSTTAGVSPSPRRPARRISPHRRLPNLHPTTVFRTTTRPPVTLPPVAARAWHHGGQGISRLG